jgi:hypothetical protein
MNLTDAYMIAIEAMKAERDRVTALAKAYGTSEIQQVEARHATKRYNELTRAIMVLEAALKASGNKVV